MKYVKKERRKLEHDKYVYGNIKMIFLWVILYEEVSIFLAR